MGQHTGQGRFKLSVGSIIGLTIGMALVIAVLCFLFIRRSVIEYPVPHQFGVGNPAFFNAAHALADPVPVGGNSIELLNNGKEIFPAMLAAIRSARKSINFEAYMFHSGHVASDFIEAFNERASAGVKVRILLDGLGSGTKLDNEDVEKLKQAGCEFSYFHPTRSWRIDRMNMRSHRRILVVDGKMAFTGGVGFADEWQGDADAPNHWRDIHARIEGPLVAKLQGVFQQHWFQATARALTSETEFPPLTHAGPVPAQVVSSKAFSAAPLSLVLGMAFASAEKSINITNAYCAPSTSQAQSLIDAVKRGVKVRILLPGLHNDQPATKAAGRSSYGDLLRGGVEIYEYQPTMIHSKTLVVDGLFSIIGSSNFDARSMEINEELDVTVYDAAFGEKLQAIFEKDLKQAKRYTLEDFKRRPFSERLSEWMIMPFHSQL